jgi:hypothetical protein
LLQLKFKKRGRSPSRVIAEKDLVPVNAEREAWHGARSLPASRPQAVQPVGLVDERLAGPVVADVLGP